MSNEFRKLKSRLDHGKPWYEVQHEIFSLHVEPTEKLLLLAIHLHTNQRRGVAWASQGSLGKELGVTSRTIQRLFRKLKTRKLIKVTRVRTGKRPQDQHNEYALELTRIHELWEIQTRTEHPSPMTGDTQPEHTTPMSGDTVENSATNTRHLRPEHTTFATRTHDTRVVIGLEVKQVASKAAKEESGLRETFPIARSSPVTTSTAFSLSPEEIKARQTLKDWTKNINVRTHGGNRYAHR